MLLCADEKIVRVLRRTLGDLDIGVELCASSDVALRKLTRERFEAIIVDCAGAGAAEVLRNARSSPGNKRAVAVAILDPDSGLRSAFDAGANFVLYKPVSVEKAKSTDPDKVIAALPGIKQANLTGGVSEMLPNHYITKPVFVGEIKADGQFDVVWKSKGLVPGDAWSPYLPGSKDLIADWVKLKCGNYNEATKVCSGQNFK